ncbi:Protein kinase domain-containing protein [Mycena sanguinolenta]|uniref:Protein kinase domain-containing protein n=1 Tax=Mycena sanguinolenta TaxID=230812 RepID=A0A8H6YC89_9AGAR|nr:Protein kinase domain-containing protein [Mycena sanguinolenta]
MSEAKPTSPSGSTSSMSSASTNPKTPLMTPKTSSPLNPTRTPINSLPSSNPPVLPVPPSGRPRALLVFLSSSIFRVFPTNRSRDASTQNRLHQARNPDRARGLPSSFDRVISSAILENPPTPPNAPPSTWWGRNIRRDRPWRDPGSPLSSGHSSPTGSPHTSPKPAPRKLVRGAGKAEEKAKAKVDDDWSDEEGHGSLFGAPLQRRPTTTVPKEQTEGWERTRQRVSEALSKLLPPALLITHDLLEISTEVLQFVPIPGLDVAATLLLNIWDNVQGVDMNRLACLRLAERCANFLLSVVQEVHEMGDKVEKELAEPLKKLVQTFTQVRDLLIRQARRPFLKRYLKREETVRDLAGCDTSLTDALSMFSLSVQMRILRQIKETEDRRDAENRAILEALRSKQQTNALGITVDKEQLTPRPGFSELPAEHTDVFPAICSIHLTQNALDLARDAADLRALMRDALATSSDVEMLRVLQKCPKRSRHCNALSKMWASLQQLPPSPDVPPGAPMQPAPPAYTPRGGVPERSATLSSSESSDTSSGGLTMPRDTLDREFIEGGIDALRRMSKGGEMLPSWTITRYEVDRDEKIGIGFFKTTPRELFVREVNIWKELKHPNVLDLYGASGASGDGPWFFVCPYERFGSLSSFLRRVAQEGDAGKNSREGDLPGVLHGDLKAANVLVDDRIHCLVADFGQSEMKSEAYRISGAAPHGTLRWQAPELMLGSSDLTPEMDVYSYAICCVEILSMGRLPWPLMSDEAVRDFVLKDNTRPKIPPSRFNTPAVQELLRVCWDREPTIRPPFSKIVKEAKELRKAAELPFERFDDLVSPPVSPRGPNWPDLENSRLSRLSPDMHPVPLPNTTTTPPMNVPSSPFSKSSVSPEPSSSESYHTVSQSWPPAGGLYTHHEDTVSSSGSEMPEPVVYSASVSSRASSIFTPSTKSSSVDDLTDVLLGDYSGYESPMPANERLSEIRNERRYRILLVHDFHPSLTLPLWNPVSIAVGAVGFLDKSSGQFVTLFNCFYPDKATSDVSGLPSVYGYGRVTTGSQRIDKRSAAQRGLDAITGLLTFNRSGGPVSQNVARRYSYPLRSGHKFATLVTETTMYRYIESLDAPKKWFKSNVDAIMHQYGPLHQIQKEDLCLVIGTLDAPDYALFVSHNHPDGQAHFNVYSSPKSKQPWGTFTTDAEPELGGPSYHEPISGHPSSASKVSLNGAPWSTVLVARLRFKPDVLEPTSL